MTTRTPSNRPAGVSSGRAVLRRLWRFLLPELAAHRLNKTLGQSPDDAGWEERVRVLEEQLRGKADAVAVVRDAYQADLARLRRLEDKLQAQLGYMTPLIPVSTALAGALYSVGTERCRWWIALDVALVGLLAVHLIGGYALARQGVSSIPLYAAGRPTIEGAISSGADVGVRVAAEELLAMEYNEATGVRLNNAIAGVGLALAWIAWLLGASAVALALQLL